ncbi:MAG: hypothetical protein V4584_17800 [Verrucomicrobiota bacterium]
MKNLILSTFALLVSVQLSSASLLEDLVGKWTVNRTEPGVRITTVFKRVGKKGLVANSTTIVPGLSRSIGVTNYRANGTVSGNVKRDGVVQNTISGTWRISGNKLTETVVITSPLFGEVDQKTTVTLANPNKLKTVNILDGSRTTGTLSRNR